MMPSTRLILDEGFSADTLERISTQCYDDDELATFPVAVVVLAHITGSIANHLSNRPVHTDEFETVKALIEPPVRSLLEAVSVGRRDDVAERVSTLSDAFLAWRES